MDGAARHAAASLPRDKTARRSGRTVLSATSRIRTTWVAAAVARRDQGFAAIGIDLEPAAALPPDLWASVCAPEEQAKLAAVRGMTPGLAARLAFCMKEAAFKCQYALSRAMLDIRRSRRRRRRRRWNVWRHLSQGRGAVWRP